MNTVYASNIVNPVVKDHVALMHKAIDKLANKVAEQHDPRLMKRVTISQHWNPKTGLHVHATGSITLRFDESVAEGSMVD